jgi:hypothetical protein
VTIQDELTALRSKYNDEEFQEGLLAIHDQIMKEKSPQVAAIVAEAFVHLRTINDALDVLDDEEYYGYGMEDLEWVAEKGKLATDPIAAVVIEAMNLFNKARSLASTWHIPFNIPYHGKRPYELLEYEEYSFDSNAWLPSVC